MVFATTEVAMSAIVLLILIVLIVAIAIAISIVIAVVVVLVVYPCAAFMNPVTLLATVGAGPDLVFLGRHCNCCDIASRRKMNVCTVAGCDRS